MSKKEDPSSAKVFFYTTILLPSILNPKTGIDSEPPQIFKDRGLLFIKAM